MAQPIRASQRLLQGCFCLALRSTLSRPGSAGARPCTVASEFRRPGPRSALRRTLATLALTAAYATSVFGEGAPSAESRLAGRAAPDIPLRLADGRTMRLSELADGKPLLITFFYRRCTGVCTPLLA